MKTFCCLIVSIACLLDSLEGAEKMIFFVEPNFGVNFSTTHHNPFGQSQFARPSSISHILRMRSKAEVFYSVIAPILIDMVNLHSIWNLTNEHCPNNAVNVEMHPFDADSAIPIFHFVHPSGMASLLPSKIAIKGICHSNTRETLNRPLFPVKLSIPVFQKLVQFSLAWNLLEDSCYGSYFRISNGIHFESWLSVVVRSDEDCVPHQTALISHV